MEDAMNNVKDLAQITEILPFFYRTSKQNINLNYFIYKRIFV